MSNSELDQVLATLKAAVDRKTYHSISFFKPYPKQELFFEMGAFKRERLFRAGNQLGKTYAGAAEMSYHLTGQYPEGWKGRKFDHPIKAWAAGVKSAATREGPQSLLCGQFGVAEVFGTGMIPRDCFADRPSLSRGVTDAYDTIQVKHYTNGTYDGISVLSFKSYEEGRYKFQGATLDVIWCDEEPPIDIYSECLARIAATGGFIYITFTPLLGHSTVVDRFVMETAPDRGEVVMTIYEALHIPPERRQSIIDAYPEHEREARAMGAILQGSGRVFPVDDEMLLENQIAADRIPPYWTKLWGISFGVSGVEKRPFAAVLHLWDQDNDVIHIHAAMRLKEGLPLQHAQMLKPIGSQVKVAWPKDTSPKEKGTGHASAEAYRQQHLLMLPDHAQWPDGSVSVEAGVSELHSRMLTGRFKVASHILSGDWGDEFHNYHRNKDGLIVHEKDSLMDATRIGLMARRFGSRAILGFSNSRYSGERKEFADGLDWNPFTGR